jgi:hypothetical protein
MSIFVTHEQLLELARLPAKTRIATLRKALRKAGIPFKELAGRAFTTEQAITAALTGHGKKPQKAGPNWAALDE